MVALVLGFIMFLIVLPVTALYENIQRRKAKRMRR